MAGCAGGYNGDGNPDLAAPGAVGGFDIYMGSGKGTFQPRMAFDSGVPIGKIATGFLRNQTNGYADIVATGAGPDITVFLNQMTSK